MQGLIARTPLFVVLMAIGGLAMLVPAGHAFALADFRTARIFLYGAVLSAFLTGLIGIATFGRVPRSVPRSQLTTVLAAFALLPLMLAIPFYEAAGQTTVVDAWFEMVSSLTGTGATLYDQPAQLNTTLHLWRALVGWMGGLWIWIMVAAILMPLTLGGVELRGGAGVGETPARGMTQQRDADRLGRTARELALMYMVLSGVLWTLLVIAGEAPFVALCHAMGTMSASGISPIGGVQNGTGGIFAELVLALFLLLALTRLWFGPRSKATGWTGLWRDPELRLGLAITAGVAGIIVARLLLIDTAGVMPIAAIWGAVFTVLSFLTTTGYESLYWRDTLHWTGLQYPGLILLSLSLIGGGVATTAGGVKLLRIHVLIRHGRRELERIVHPASVGSGGRAASQSNRQGAVMAWVFFMLFAISLAVVMLILTALGVGFEPAMVLSIAALTNTGPLVSVAGADPVSFATIPVLAKGLLAATMVLGRLETLALVALFNPGFWRS